MHGRSTTGVTVVMLGLLSWLMAPSVAIAKGVPPFSVDIEVRHGHAQVHELVRVVVRLWRDAEHSQPRRAWPQFRGSL